MSTDSMSGFRSATTFRFRNIFIFTVLFALVLQTIIVTYNVLTGYVQVSNAMEYTGRVVYSTILSTVLGLLLVIPDIILIRILNRRLGWQSQTGVRIPAEIIFVVLIAVLVGGGGTTGAHLLHPYDQPFRSVLINNVLIASVINLILMTGLEAWFFFREGRISRHKYRRLENELASVRFEMLKNQLNPHFLFNSLNVLSGLVETDQKKAQLFIDAFAKNYHYVLETIEKPVVTLEEEMQFAKSYIYLQQIRHGEHVSCHFSIPSGCSGMFLPPLSLQIVLENILKHNTTSGDLDIRISAEEGRLMITNKVCPRSSTARSTGLGQKNLLKRYTMISDERPSFGISDQLYVVKLPLLKAL